MLPGYRTSLKNWDRLFNKDTDIGLNIKEIHLVVRSGFRVNESRSQLVYLFVKFSVTIERESVVTFNFGYFV